MRGRLIGYTAVYRNEGEEVDWVVPHEPGPGNFYGRVWPTLRDAAEATVNRGGPNARIVAVYEIEDGV